LAGIILIPIAKNHDRDQFSYNYSVGLALTRLTVRLEEDFGDKAILVIPRLEQIHRHSPFGWGKS